MKKIFAFVVVAMLMLAIPAAAANYKLTGTFTGGYDYSAGVGTDNLSLSLNFSFDEAGIMTAYAPINLVGGFGIASGWWVKFATEPLNVIISDNNKTYGWAGLESTFGLLQASNSGNRYSKVWGTVAPGLTYAAQVRMDDTTAPMDAYAIAGQLAADLPLGLKLTLDLGGLNDGAAYHLGESLALTGTVPVINGKFKVAVGNFADLNDVLAPPPTWPITPTWGTDDLMAFAAYAGVTEIGLGPVKLDEVSYKMGMVNVDGALLGTSSDPSFYELGLQEATVNASAKFAPLSIKFKNAVWFPSFTALGGYNANLDVEAGLGDLVLGLNVDSKLNWQAGLKWGGKAVLRADYEGAIGALGGTVGYTYNLPGVLKYSVDPLKAAHQIDATLYYEAPFGLYAEAWGGYDFLAAGAYAGLYAKYENTYTTVPYVVDLKTLVAGRFQWDTTAGMEAIGMLKLDSTINGQWSAGLLFITKNYVSPALSFEPIVSAYAKYLATNMVTVTGTVTYRYNAIDPLLYIYAQLKGDVKVSANATASVYWGESGLKAVGSTDPEAAYPWGGYFAVTDRMDWDTFGANFTIKF